MGALATRLMCDSHTATRKFEKADRKTTPNDLDVDASLSLPFSFPFLSLPQIKCTKDDHEIKYRRSTARQLLREREKRDQ